MKLTKYEHACFTVEKDGRSVVIDPGEYTTDLPALENVVAIVVTHEHPDHFDPTALGALIAHNPEATIYAHESITKQLGDTLPNKPVSADMSVNVANFTLEFLGEKHAVIHPDIPVVANLAVMINNTVYYPGDSFTSPERPVDVLALPSMAPWMKMSEAFDFLMAVKPRMVFPTHDAIASDAGKALADRMIPMFASKVGTEYLRITGTIEIDG